MTVDKDGKSVLPEATSKSNKKKKLKLCVAEGVEASTTKKSKLGKDSANDTNALSESKEQVPFADRKWKRKQKSPISKVKTVYSFNTLFDRFYFLCVRPA